MKLVNLNDRILLMHMPKYVSLSISEDHQIIAIAYTSIKHKTYDYIKSQELIRCSNSDSSLIDSLNDVAKYFDCKIRYTEVKFNDDNFMKLINFNKDYLILVSDHDFEVIACSKILNSCTNQVKNSDIKSHSIQMLTHLKNFCHFIKSDVISETIEIITKNNLINYLESNGLKIKAEFESDKIPSVTSDTVEGGFKNIDTKSALLGKGIQRHIFSTNKDISIYSEIDFTVTEMGKQKLLESIKNPYKDEKVILEYQKIIDFLSKSSLIDEFSKTIKLFKYNSSIRSLIEIQLDPHSSVVFGKSCNEKSIYSRKSLDEGTVAAYKSFVKKILEMKINCKVLTKLLIFLKNFPIEPPSQTFFKKLVDSINCPEFCEMSNILDQNISKNFDIKSALDDKYYNIIHSSKDKYLQLAREIYDKTTKEIQNLILDIIKDTDLKIDKTQCGEICISGKFYNEPHHLKEASCGKLRHIRNYRFFKSNINMENKNNFFNSKNFSGKNAYNFNKTSDRYYGRISSYDKCDIPKIGSKKTINGYKIQVIKINNSKIFYSNNKIRLLNEIIRDSLDQIFEIQGRLCKSLLYKLENYNEYQTRIASIIGELDYCISLGIFLKKSKEYNIYDNNAVNPTFFLSINNVSNLLIINSRRVNYGIEDGSLSIITGPNMAGKSSYLRNLCHLLILNQLGCKITQESDKVEIFEEIYYLTQIDDVLEFDANIRNNISWSSHNYSTARRIVFVDELDCSYLVQIGLLKMLKNRKITAIFITHDSRIIKFCKTVGIKIFNYDNHILKDGTFENRRSLDLVSIYFDSNVMEKIILKIEGK